MKVAIHQPEFLPWPGFFHKLYLSDVFVLLDTVQFKKNNYQNRNRLRIGGKTQWLTLPLHNHPLATLIKDIHISWRDPKLAKKHLTTLDCNYGKTPFYDDLRPFLHQLYEQKIELLADFNSQYILFFAEKLGIDRKIVHASTLPLSGKSHGGTAVTLEICQTLKADTYISGGGAHTYLQVDEYDKAGIRVYFQEFHVPVYNQGGKGEFLPYLSAFDLYCHHGPESLNIILSNNSKSI